MNRYSMPPDIREKEKIIGGVLNLAQFFWVLGGLVVGATMFAGLFMISRSSALGLCAVPLPLVVGVTFAFYKKEDLTLFQYLYHKHRHNKMEKKMTNKRRTME